MNENFWRWTGMTVGLVALALGGAAFVLVNNLGVKIDTARLADRAEIARTKILDSRLDALVEETMKTDERVTKGAEQARQADASLTREVAQMRALLRDLPDWQARLTNVEARVVALPVPVVATNASEAVGETNAAPASRLDLYEIQPGDTLGSLARKFKTSTKVLMEANPDLVPTNLRIGQKLRVP